MEENCETFKSKQRYEILAARKSPEYHKFKYRLTCSDLNVNVPVAFNNLTWCRSKNDVSVRGLNSPQSIFIYIEFHDNIVNKLLSNGFIGRLHN